MIGYDWVSPDSHESWKRLYKKWMKAQEFEGLTITVSPKDAYLHEIREWSCLLPNNKHALIPCGDTHVRRIQPIERVSVTLKKETESDFVMMSKLL